ncbi:YdiY family protein [Thermodesulfobacteriota bacterium]
MWGSRNSLIRLVCLGLFSICLMAVTPGVYAVQQDDPGVESAPSEKTDKAWAPPTPPPDEFDWIQLKSGEWLKGSLKALYEQKLEFDSVKLKLLEFDWKDVKVVRSPRICSVRIDGKITVDGTLEVTGNKVIVTDGEKKQEFERSQIVAIAPGGTKEIHYWSGKVSAGLNITSGNTRQTQWNAIAKINRRTSSTRFITDYLGNFTKSEGVETVNNQRINTFFDVFRTKKYFIRPVFGEYYKDPFKNIKDRVTGGTGIGYHIISNPKTHWDVSGGPAVQRTRFESVRMGQDSSETTPAFVAGTRYDTELTDTLDFNFQYTLQLANKQSGRYTHHMVAMLETELTEWLDFDITTVWDRTQNPQPEANGMIPKKDDFYLIFSLGINF